MNVMSFDLRRNIKSTPSGKPVATYVYALHRKNEVLWKATYVDTFFEPET